MKKMKHNNIGFALCCYASQPYLKSLEKANKKVEKSS